MLGWLWQTLTWFDVLDIAIMAWILYRAMLVIRGTRAIQSLLGLLVLVALYLVSGWIGLYTIHWVLEKFFVYIVLAVIILFQQDIRRGLATAGGRLFPSIRTPTRVSMLEDLVRASFALASRRIGALIAIEREASLEEYVEPAAHLDALVSQELLLAIFHPTSPLHDGAVVIQKGRLAVAKAFLPLSHSKTVSRFFGTRHRAAIGLTEETDALVIVVSEERGTVSLVEHGQIMPTTDVNQLRDLLQETLQPGGGPEPAEPPAAREER